MYRAIHTFKGTFNQLGFHHLPAMLHEVEGEMLRRRAEQVAAADARHWDLADLVFADGVSVRVAASEMSGRGVGMGAVKASVEELGGSVQVSTVPGQGTEFLLRIPFPPVVERRV